MSNIDMTRIVTAQARAAQVATAHGRKVKAACRARILQVMPFEAQQNLTQAMALHAAELMRGANTAEARAVSGLTEADFPLVMAGRAWITAMQDACRAMARDTKADPDRDAAWPPPPEGLAGLVARF